MIVCQEAWNWLQKYEALYAKTSVWCVCSSNINSSSEHFCATFDVFVLLIVKCSSAVYTTMFHCHCSNIMLYIHCLFCYTWSFVKLCCCWQVFSFWVVAGDIGNNFLQTAVVLDMQLYPSNLSYPALIRWMFCKLKSECTLIIAGICFFEWPSSQNTIAVAWEAVIYSCMKSKCGCITVQEISQVERNETWLLSRIISVHSVVWLCTK